ncbi:unnamed protein product [Pylaiella littoralis]
MYFNGQLVRLGCRCRQEHRPVMAGDYAPATTTLVFYGPSAVGVDAHVLKCLVHGISRHRLCPVWYHSIVDNKSRWMFPSLCGNLGAAFPIHKDRRSTWAGSGSRFSWCWPPAQRAAVAPSSEINYLGLFPEPGWNVVWAWRSWAVPWWAPACPRS